MLIWTCSSEWENKKQLELRSVMERTKLWYHKMCSCSLEAHANLTDLLLQPAGYGP